MTYPGTLPTSPAVGDLITAVQADLIAQALSYLSTETTPSNFRATGGNATVVSANTNIAFTAVDDTLSAWNASTHLWACPVAGRYLISAQTRCGATPAAPTCVVMINATQQQIASSPSSLAGANAGLSIMRALAVSDTVSIQSIAGYTMSATGNLDNWLSIFRVGP